MTASSTGGWGRVKEKEEEEPPESEEESGEVRGCSHSLQGAAKLTQTYGLLGGPKADPGIRNLSTTTMCPGTPGSHSISPKLILLFEKRKRVICSQGLG